MRMSQKRGRLDPTLSLPGVKMNPIADEIEADHDVIGVSGRFPAASKVIEL